MLTRSVKRRRIQSDCLWAVISSLRVIESVLWPFITDKEAVRAMQCNKVTYDTLSSYPFKDIVHYDVYAKYVVGKPRPHHMTSRGGGAHGTDWCPSFVDSVTYEQFGPRGPLPPTITYLDKCSAVTTALPPFLWSIPLPSSLRTLHAFNMPEGDIPASLRSLHLRCSQSPEHILYPSSLTELTFGIHNGDKPFDVGVLPRTLLKLQFAGNSIRCSTICGVLPPLITELVVCVRIDKDIVWPLALTTLQLHRFQNYTLPDTVQHLYLSQYDNNTNIPSFLISLCIGWLSPNTRRTGLPESLTQLVINDGYENSWRLPSSLRTVHFGNRWNGVLPPSVTDVRLGVYFNHQLPVLPPSLRRLTIDKCNYNHPIDRGVLPDSLRELFFLDAMTQHIHLPPMTHVYFKHLDLNERTVCRDQRELNQFQQRMKKQITQGVIVY